MMLVVSHISDILREFCNDITFLLAITIIGREQYYLVSLEIIPNTHAIMIDILL